MLIRSLTIVIFFLSCNVFADQIESVSNMLQYKSSVVSWVNSMKMSPRNQQELDQTAESVLTYSVLKGIDVGLLLGIIATESRFNAGASAKDGSKGLTQVMPRWHRDKLRGRDIHDPAVAIDVGTTILKDCLITYRGNINGALNCYRGTHGTRSNHYTKTVIGYARQFKTFLSNIKRHPVT